MAHLAGLTQNQNKLRNILFLIKWDAKTISSFSKQKMCTITHMVDQHDFWPPQMPAWAGPQNALLSFPPHGRSCGQGNHLCSNNGMSLTSQRMSPDIFPPDLSLLITIMGVKSL